MPAKEFLDTMAGSGTLAEIEDVLERMWSVHAHVPTNVRMQMALAAVEIGANIVEHAAEGRPVRIHMEVEVDANEVRVAFADEGAPAHVNLTEVQMPGPMAERGRGLALAQAVLAKLNYRRRAANHWTLISHTFG